MLVVIPPPLLIVILWLFIHCSSRGGDTWTEEKVDIERRQRGSPSGAEHPSVSLHSLPCESHCFGDTVTSYSEDSAALMDMCVKSEPEDHVDVQVNGLISIPCSLSMQYKSETGIVKVEQHSQLESPSSPEFTVNDSAHDLLHNNSVKMGSSLIRVGHDVQAIGALEQSVGSSTSGLPNKASKWKCNDGFILSAQKLQCLQCRKVFKSQSHLEKHLKIHSGGKYYCMQCESSFSPTCQLKHHQLIHSCLKQTTCTQYENYFSQIGTL
uniref:C2H2-type domain-containing protein n=1 Tax=Scleropages formosus TaxID=113540 RepID=A0A8C9VK93_SCLFO